MLQKNIFQKPVTYIQARKLESLLAFQLCIPLLQMFPQFLSDKTVVTMTVHE